MPHAGAAPMRILQLMHVNGLTREQVASHLQVIHALAIYALSMAQGCVAVHNASASMCLHLKIVPEPCQHSLLWGLHLFQRLYQKAHWHPACEAYF